MHETILMKWIIDFNNGIEHLTFDCQTNHIWTKAWDFHTKVKCHVNTNHGHFLPSCGRCQAPMFKGSLKINIFLLHTCFPKHEVNKIFGIVYPHY
jgi:hypothetical protein